MTTACLTGVFRINEDAQVRRLPNGDAVVSLMLTYVYGTKTPDGQRNTQYRNIQVVEAGLWGSRASRLAPRLLEHSLVFAVIEDAHIEVYTNAEGHTNYKIAGRLGRVDIIADPMMTGILRTPRRPRPPNLESAEPADNPSF